MAELKKTLGGWRISAQDVDAALARLDRLPPEDYRRVLEQLDEQKVHTKPSPLARMVEKMNPAQKKALVLQLEAKGLAPREGAEEPLGAPLQPPSRPGLFRNDKKLPEPARALLFNENKAMANGYYREHRAYLERYQGAAARATSPLDLRALGPPVWPASFSQPGVDYRDPLGKEFQSRWSREVMGPEASTSMVRAYRSIEDQVADLTGRMRAGTLGLKVDFAASSSLSPLPNTAGGSVHWGIEGRLTQYGHAELNERMGVRSSLGGTYAQAELTPDGVKQQVGLEVKAGAVAVGLSASSDGSLELEATAGGVGVAVGLGARGGVEAAVIGELALGDSVKVKAKVGFEAQLSDSQRVREAWDRNNNGVFRALPELQQQLSWDLLSPQRQEVLRADGWNERRWAQALAQPGRST